MEHDDALPRGSGDDANTGIANEKSTVRIEQQYTVEEYDIIVLTATKPADLVAWLNQHGYRVPEGADATVGSYLRQGMHFFLAKVNLGEDEE